MHKEEKYIVFFLDKIWNEENDRFHNSLTHYGSRQKESSSLLLFLSYSIPVSSLVLRKKPCNMRHLAIFLQYTALFSLFGFFFLLSSFFVFEGWLIFLYPFSVSEKQFQQDLSRTVLYVFVYSVTCSILVPFSCTHKVPDNSCSKTVSQNMPDPVKHYLIPCQKARNVSAKLKKSHWSHGG